MTANIEIKPATIDDVPLILQFIKELAEYEKLLHQVVTTEEILQETLFGEKKYAEVIIAYLENQPVGFAIFFHNFSSFVGRPGIYVEDIYVKPEVRGKGIGKKLLVYIAALAKERCCGRLEWSVLDWNSPAIDFYKSLNAKPMDEWTVYRLTGEAMEKLADSEN